MMATDPPPYEHPPRWIPLQMRQGNPDYDNDLQLFLPRKVVLRRIQKADTLGFNVRGGDHPLLGMYISWVKPDSEAERLGLKEGDQILEVNGFSFECIEHAKAVGILKGSLEVTMIVRYFPYGFRQSCKSEITSGSGPAAYR